MKTPVFVLDLVIVTCSAVVSAVPQGVELPASAEQGAMLLLAVDSTAPSVPATAQELQKTFTNKSQSHQLPA